MSLIELHPDELLDRDARGALSATERSRLDAHLATCAACRIERTLRADFADELAAAAAEASVSGAVSRALLAVQHAPPPVARPPVARPVARARSTRVAAALAFAAAMVTGVAVAGFTGALRVVLAPPRAPAQAALPADELAPRATHLLMAPTPRAEPVVAAEPDSAPSPVAAPAIVPAAPVLAPSAPASPSPAPGRAWRPAERVVDAPPARDEAPPAAPTSAPARSAAQLFADANAARRGGDDLRAVALYRELDRAFPASAEARVARVTLARLLLARGDAPAALEEADRALATGPSSLTEEVLVDRAVALARLGDASGEAATWAALLRAYPASVHGARARARLAELHAP